MVRGIRSGCIRFRFDFLDAVEVQKDVQQILGQGLLIEGFPVCRRVAQRGQEGTIEGNVGDGGAAL